MSRTQHEKNVSKASDAIRRVHADQSVPLQKTLESLEELFGMLDMCILAVRDDLARAEEYNAAKMQ